MVSGKCIGIEHNNIMSCRLQAESWDLGLLGWDLERCAAEVFQLYIFVRPTDSRLASHSQP